MKTYLKHIIRIILPLIFFVGCTQFLEETESSHAYDGTDGCIYCHTNKARLQVLAHEEEDSHGGGGG